ncbi:MAG TPA: RuBisCO large subunit C-terminal-like domain-containing protein [Alphaproteobacteria bacterium]|nr:RuBisCO large subunit C-terminal-like domain-containing protein [Alphaproteobacteria bacterium]
MASRLTAIYRIRADEGSIDRRADAIATEQSVEMPISAIDDPQILADIVGRVAGIKEIGEHLFEARIDLAVTTTGLEAGQLMNMLFGNTSIHDDVVLHDVEFPPEMFSTFAGPRHGIDGLRALTGANGRAMTCSALKPQGLSPARLAELAGQLARGGLDFIKDDHGLADQAYSPFAERVRACARAVREARAATGRHTLYVPSLSGDLDRLRVQIDFVRENSLAMVLIAPMIVGIPALSALVNDYPEIAFMAHPAMAGAARIAPPLLLGRLFRLFGADATIFPNHGGRFGYSRETCRQLAEAAAASWGGLRMTAPVPAGGMTLERVPEMLDFYGPDVILLIGGGLLAARERLTESTAAFTRSVQQHQYK